MKPLTKPREELTAAAEALTRMETASSLRELDEYWKEFLRRLERVWTKSLAHLKRSPKFEGWSVKRETEELRKRDPLLSYLRNARGADEHTVEDVTETVSGSIGINPAEGNSMYIEKLVVERGLITELRSPDKLRLDVTPGAVHPRDVLNRGRSYAVPKAHLGQPINGRLVDLAKLGLTFYERFVARAEEEFVK